MPKVFAIHFFLFIFNQHNLFAQDPFFGSVVNQSNEQPIPYATIGWIKANQGVSADENGKFSFAELHLLKSDTLLISSVGYETLKISSQQFPRDHVFRLIPKRALLPTYVVGGIPRAALQLNPIKNCGTNYIMGTAYLSQVAQLMVADSIGGMVTSVEICKYGIAIIDPVKCTFRIRIYAVDPYSGAPGDDLVNQVIEVETSGRRVTVDLIPYQINLTDSAFFVALEWVKIPENGNKESYKMDGQKTRYMAYSPHLAFENLARNKETDDGEHGVWMLGYNGKWRHWPAARKLMIAATVK